ncbi:MAG: hypothetical protein HY538_05205 [Deltaproteobacteria bacterium]|nr:hypothetical protein [Deltaproteobacteria bacterium]
MINYNGGLELDVKKGEVERFLKKWREASLGFIDFVPRRKNLEGLTQLGLTLSLARKILRGLKAQNYVSGPEADRDRDTKDIWVFGIQVGGSQVYIKIKIFKWGHEYRAKCLSFHPAEKPLRFPFAGG